MLYWVTLTVPQIRCQVLVTRLLIKLILLNPSSATLVYIIYITERWLDGRTSDDIIQFNRFRLYRRSHSSENIAESVFMPNKILIFAIEMTSHYQMLNVSGSEYWNEGTSLLERQPRFSRVLNFKFSSEIDSIPTRITFENPYYW